MPRIQISQFALSAVLCTACATAGDSSDVQKPPDAAPVGVDAPPMVDAPPLAPDAAAPDAGPSCSQGQLLVNPAFDLGPTGWSENGTFAIITTDVPAGVTPHSGSYIAWLGALIFTTDTMTQDVPIPAGTTSLQLSGQRWILTNETGGSVYDTLVISVRDTSGNVLETLRTWSNIDAGGAWASFSENLAGSYAGQTIRIHMEASNDTSNASAFLLDTLLLQATVCQ